MNKKTKRGRWFSLDHMMGKALCILLVVILTVGAFLTPKMINNLYDAGTLMQITYMDMNLSTYAVAYTSFPEKMEAIARAETAGERLAVLPAEESEEKISDEELVGIVNRELEAISESSVMILWDGWWDAMTGENLVSREKNTVYVQPGGGMQDHGPGQEMAPIQFWILTFELTQEQREISREAAEREKWVRLAGKGAVELPVSWYATERLVVCLDADFYKIYALAAEGEEEAVGLWYEAYGWKFPEIYSMTLANKSGEYDVVMPDYITEQQMYLTDLSAESWREYWEVRPEEIAYGAERYGEIIGYMRFRDEEAGADVGEGDVSVDGGSSSETAVGIDGDAYEMVEADSSDAESMAAAYDREAAMLGSGAAAGTKTVVYEAQDTVEEMMLAVGITGEWSGVDNGMWVQKAGCREFFEMMQF